MNDRARIFSAINDALTPLQERAALPELDPAQWVCPSRLTEGGSWEDFRRNFEAVNGTFLTSFEALSRLLRDANATEGYADPGLLEELPETFRDGLTLHETIDRGSIDRYAFGITRAHAAIAESGTVILRDLDTPDRLAALAPWIHITLVAKEALFSNVTEAIDDLGEDPNTVWVTGPSKTADVEGILIEGVHGPGIQVCLPI
jgi:L-lactate dehydrogenase complex protein LldG